MSFTLVDAEMLSWDSVATKHSLVVGQFRGKKSLVHRMLDGCTDSGRNIIHFDR